MTSVNTEIINAFSESSDYYHEHALLQKNTAKRLARALEPWQYSLPPGAALEIGAGTGFFTDYLVTMFSKRKKTITDASAAMLSFNKARFFDKSSISFEIFNPEFTQLENNQYALIVGNFVAHWFADPSATLSKLSKALKPGGFMLMSFPGNQSFPQWRNHCLELGLPFTANELPDIEQVVVNLSLGPFKVDFYEDQASEEYPDLYSFYQHLKKTGMATSRNGKSLNRKQFNLLDSFWREKNNGKLSVHYHMAFLAVKRDL